MFSQGGKAELLALATLMGTIIGVGIFGLPFVAAQAGFLPVAVTFIVLGIVMVLTHLMYGEIAMRTKELHRLPGYCRLYLNSGAEALAMTTSGIGLFGSLLLYIVVGGEFLRTLVGPWIGVAGSLPFITIYWLLGALLILLGSKSISRVELWSMGIFFGIFILVIGFALPSVRPEHLATVDLAQVFLPYGVVLFALSGTSIIPELLEILGPQHRARLARVIITGTLVPALVYIIFTAVVTGVTGPGTSRDAFGALGSALPGPIVMLGLLFGLLTTFTSFISLGITLKKQLQYDGKFHPMLAWALTCGLPYLLVLAGLKDYIRIMGFIGAALLGVDLTLTTVVYLKAKSKGTQTPAYQISLSRLGIVALTVILVAGAVIEVIRNFSLSE